MKKTAALFIALAIILNLFTLLVLAEDSAASVDEPYFSVTESQDIGVINNCFYDASSKKVELSGTINHDVMVTHSNYNIAVYSVPFGQTLTNVINASDSKPVASSAISVKFQFSISVETISGRFSAYAVVIYSDTGEMKLVDEPKYPYASSDYSFELGNKDNYKGVSSNLLSLSSDAGASTAVVPVYLDRLLNNGSKGYLYSLEGTYIYFDETYVKELDVKVKSLAVTGCRVYLQFLQAYTAANGVTVLPQETPESYGIPDMSIDKTLMLISSFTDFLCERYSSSNTGISGIIIGSNTDKLYDGKNYVTLTDYLSNYARYMMIVGNIARTINPSLDIVVPVSDYNSYAENTLASANAPECSPSILLDGVSSLLDGYFAEGFAFSTMIETMSVPYGISTETLANGKFSTDGYAGINADNVQIYVDYLTALNDKYDSASTKFIFLWSVPQEISGDVLSCAYSYSYFKLLPYDNLSSFVVSFESLEQQGDLTKYPEISRIMKYIDTSESFNVTEPQLEFLRAANWYAVIDNMYDGKLDTRRILIFDEMSALPNTVIGNYIYYDFSYYTNLSSWFVGNDCDSLKIDYSNISGRSLEAHFNSAVKSPSEFSEIFCSYDYPENFVYTPYMSLKFSLKNDNNINNALYEVKFVFGSDKNVSEVTKICSPYEDIELLFDISDFCEVSMADYIKIGVRCLTGDDGGYSLSLASVRGYSSEYLSEELTSLISDERLRIRDMLEKKDETDSEKVNTVMIVAGVAIVIAVIGVGIFMCFKSEE